MHDRPSPLLQRFLPGIRAACTDSPALDLACGNGRNGLFLVRQGLSVVFADRDAGALESVARQLEQRCAAAELWQLDLERGSPQPLHRRQFGAIIVFRYLHRPLLPYLHQAVVPGGLLIYETFTVGQAALGRPRNPDFLLQPGELLQRFGNWPILHQFEGRRRNDAGRDVAIAQLVATRPHPDRPLPAPAAGTDTT